MQAWSTQTHANFFFKFNGVHVYYWHAKMFLGEFHCHEAPFCIQISQSPFLTLRDRSLITTWGGRQIRHANTANFSVPPYANRAKISVPPYANR